MKQSLPFLAYCAALVAIGIMVGILGPTLDSLAAATGSTLGGISIILALRSAGYLSGSFAAGHWYDRVPGHPLLALAVLTAAGAMALIPLQNFLWILGLVVLVMGLADGFLDVGSNTLLVWTYKRKANAMLNGLHFSFGFGALLAPQVVNFSREQGQGITGAYWISSALLLPLVLVFLRMPSPAHKEGDSASLKLPSKIHWNIAAPVMGLFFLYGGAEAAFGSWIYSYATAMQLADKLRAADMTTLFWGMLAAGRLAGAWIAHYLSPGRMLAVDLLGSVLSLALVLLMPQSEAALWIASAGIGLSLASFFPTLLAVAGPRVAGGRVTGKVTSLFFLAGGSGNMLLPWLIGQVFEFKGPQAAMAGIFAAVVSMTLLFGVFRGVARED